MEHHMTASWGRAILTPLLFEDIEKLRVSRNRERKWFIYSEEISEEEQKVWYERYFNTPGDYMFKISPKCVPNAFIGVVGLYNVDKIKKCAEFGRIIVDKTLTDEKGMGYDATVCACRIGFKYLQLSEIYLEVLTNNFKAIRTYVKAGFEDIGTTGDIMHMRITAEYHNKQYE